MKRLPLLISLMAGGLFLIGCNGAAPSDSGKTTSEKTAWKEQGGPKVVTSFPPLYCFALNVAGDDASVKTILTGQGVHGAEQVRIDDMKLLNKADILFVNGLGLDERLGEKLRKGASSSKLKLVNLGARIDKKLLEETRFACNHDHGEGHHEEHEHHDEDDPHVWLGTDTAAVLVEGIAAELSQVDPPHAENYKRRATEYVAKLKKLREDGREALKGKKDRKLVAFHGSLGYFARTYDLEIVDVVQQVPGSEPNTRNLVKLIKTCVDNKVRLIAVEPQYSTLGSAKRILEELKRGGVEDATTAEIDPLETATETELDAGWYERKMRANIEALTKAMK